MEAIDAADPSALPGLGSLDAALAEVLTGLETLLAGVLALVADLCAVSPSVVCFNTNLSLFDRLTDVAALLEALSLDLTLGALGL